MKKSFVIVVTLLLLSLIVISSLIYITYSTFAPSVFESVEMGVFRVQKGDPIQSLARKIEQSLNINNSTKWKIYIDPKISNRKASQTLVGGGNAVFLLLVAKAYGCKCVASSKEMCFSFVE